VSDKSLSEPDMIVGSDRREQSANRFGIESWAVDSTYHISHIHIIESLDDGFAGRTGTRLFQQLETLCHGTEATPILHNPHNRTQLFDLLNRFTRDAEQGQYPLLHFETHGIAVQSGQTTSPGIVLASDEGVTWQELAPSFTAINEATQLRLITFMAACYGADLATLIQPLDRAPVRLVVGPTEELSARVIETATINFYRTLLQTSDGNAAFGAINSRLDPGDPGFWKLPAEALFLDILKNYYNESSTQDRIAARAEGDIAPLALKGFNADAIGKAREKRKMEIHKELFDQCYEKFFFVDKYPEIAERFILSFERCFLEPPEGA
jgi:hypothetical protein